MENIRSVAIEITLVDENGQERTVSNKQRTSDEASRDAVIGPVKLMEEMTIRAAKAAWEATGLE